MKILYNSTDGKIYYAVPDRDWFYFKHSTNITLTAMAIDELDPANKALCIDLLRMAGKVDAGGLNKYYIDTITGN
ncbi:MAG: hypothetical protein NUW09_07975, partial [Deltaproteobacteria bacterium]|nr:hypothetical protein [Deltaproteobacteria bacterium]